MTDLVRVEGPYRLRKAEPARRRCEYPTFEAAEAAARRLAALNPSETFVIAQEVGRIRTRRQA